MNNTLKLLLDHRSVRKYKKDKLSRKTIDLIIESAQMAPSSSNFQAYTMIEVIDRQKRETLYKLSGDQEWLLQAPLVLLFCGDLHRGQQYYKNVKYSDVFSNTESFMVATVDASLAAQKALIAAQSLGLGGVFVGGIRNDMEKVANTFDLPDKVFPLFALCLGNPDEINEIKPRLPKELIHKIDTYNYENEEELIEKYDDINYEYYNMRTGGKNPETWTERSGRMLSLKPRFEVGDFLRRRGLLKK